MLSAYLSKIRDLFFSAAEFARKPLPKLAPPESPNRGGAQKGAPVNSQYVVIFTQRTTKVP